MNLSFPTCASSSASDGTVAGGRSSLLDDALLQSLLDGETRSETLKKLVTTFSIVRCCCLVVLSLSTMQR